MKSILENLGIRVFSSGLECYDKLLIDGIPSDIISVDCGRTTALKTIFQIQKAFSIIKQTNGNIIYIDTEGGALFTLVGWKEKFEKLFDIKTNIVLAEFTKPNWALTNTSTEFPTNNIVLVTIRDIIKLFDIHGTPIKLKISEKGKIDIIRVPFDYDKDEEEDNEEDKPIKPKKKKEKMGDELDITNSPIGQLLKRFNPVKSEEEYNVISGVFYDSLIELFKQRIPGTRLNFGARAFALHSLLGSMQRIAEIYHIPVIGTMHTSRDPADPLKQRETPSALEVLSYNTKFIVLFQTPYFQNPISIQDLRKLNWRDISIWRHPTKAPMSEKYTIAISNEGFKEVTPEEKK